MSAADDRQIVKLVDNWSATGSIASSDSPLLQEGRMLQ